MRWNVSHRLGGRGGVFWGGGGKKGWWFWHTRMSGQGLLAPRPPMVMDGQGPLPPPMGVAERFVWDLQGSCQIFMKVQPPLCCLCVGAWVVGGMGWVGGGGWGGWVGGGFRKNGTTQHLVFLGSVSNVTSITESLQNCTISVTAGTFQML